jgi:hypothetical protein
MHDAKSKVRNLLLQFCLLNIVFCLAGCSIPNLEDPACTEARTAIREFYSFHFGNDMGFSPENLNKRERFLTAALFREVADEQEGTDPFTTGTSEFPKAFRVGECREIAPDKAEFQVVLFWRDDVRSEQREIKAVAVKQNDKWLLDTVER